MDTLDTKRLEMFIRVHENSAQFAAALPEGSYGAGLFAQLDEVIEGLKSHAYEQSKGRSSVRESTGSKAAARDELFRRLEAIGRTARVMAFTMPGLEEKFRTPRGVGDQTLLTLARTVGNEVFPLKAEFVKRGLGADFIAELDEAAVAFEAAINRKAQGRGKHVAATAAIDKMVERGLRIVREIGALVLNTYADDPSTLAAWQSASHVERPTRRSRGKSNGSPEPAPAQG